MDLVDYIEKRRSVRTYDGNDVLPELLDKLNKYLQNNESSYFRFEIVNLTTKSGMTIGDYGVIRGTSYYIAAIMKKEFLSRLDIAVKFGYQFEKIILQATKMGLGTCWIGGTFKRKDFIHLLDIEKDEEIMMLASFGYEAPKRFKESSMRMFLRADSRKPFDQLFYYQDFNSPMHSSIAGPHRYPLEMVRLAPSAKNRQPWRIVKRNGRFDFYIPEIMMNYTFKDYNLTYNDIGIATCHFELAMEKIGENGTWSNAYEIQENGYVYVCSYLQDKKE